MQRGDIVFVQGKGMVSKLIRYFDGGGSFSHMAIAISDSVVIEADVGIKVSVRQFDESKYNIVEIVDLGFTFEQRIQIMETAFKYIGTKYDYKQLIWYILVKTFKLKGKNKLNNPNILICSEYVYDVLNEDNSLKELGIKDKIKNGIDLTPNQFYDLIKFISYA